MNSFQPISTFLVSLLLLLQHASCSPVMHTYIDDTIPEHRYKNQLEIYTNAWQRAGWDVKILTPADASKHHLHLRFKQKLDVLGLVLFNRNSYMRNLAMEMSPSGGFFTDIFVYPLHKVDVDDIDFNGNVKLPNNGEMTFHDGVGGTAMSGDLHAWNRINSYLVDHIKKNAHASLQGLGDNLIHYERNHLVVNIFRQHDRDICDKASNKFVLRLHQIDFKAMKVKPMKTDVKVMYISKWNNFYDVVCWQNRINPSQLGVPFTA